MYQCKVPKFFLLIPLFLSSCMFVPKTTTEPDQQCKLVTKKVTLELKEVKGNIFRGCNNPSCIIVAPLAAGVVLPAGSFIVSGSIVAVGNTIHWIEGQGRCDESETRKSIDALVESTKSAGGQLLTTVEESIVWFEKVVSSHEKETAPNE